MGSQKKMANSTWQALLKSALETEEIEIDCQECYDLMDMYAERILEGADAEEIMPTVKQHLKQCNCCFHQFEALMIMLREIAEQDKASARTS